MGAEVEQRASKDVGRWRWGWLWVGVGWVTGAVVGKSGTLQHGVRALCELDLEWLASLAVELSGVRIGVQLISASGGVYVLQMASLTGVRVHFSLSASMAAKASFSSE